VTTGAPLATCLAVPERAARVVPVAPDRYQLVAILGREAYEQLMASRDLLAHAVPSGALVEVLERAIAAQHAQLLKQRCAATTSPREQAPGPVSDMGVTVDPRQVPAAVRREVWARDGGRCTFVGADGHRCEERARVEVDHVVPVALGGTATAANLRLLCRAHNQFAAERALGRSHVDARRNAAQQAAATARDRRAAERYHRERERAQLEAKRREIARQREELGGAFRTLGYRGALLERALAYCACKPEAPPAERLRYALGAMAPNARREPAAVASAAGTA
jgi:hypothetical protein